MTQIINKVNHDVTILDENNNIIKVFPGSEDVIRLKEAIEPVMNIEGVPITHTTFTEPEDLPPEQDDVYYIVSQMIKNNLSQRRDLLVPTQIQRNEFGVVLGARALGV